MERLSRIDTSFNAIPSGPFTSVPMHICAGRPNNSLESAGPLFLISISISIKSPHVLLCPPNDQSHRRDVGASGAVACYAALYTGLYPAPTFLRLPLG